MSFYVKKRRPPFINIVTLIDILVILLIFFIVTSTFKKDQPQVTINLPDSKESQEAEAENAPSIITVTAEEQIFLDQKPITVEALAEAVRKIQETTPQKPVSLNADRKASFGLIIGILDAMKNAGVKNLPAFTQKPKN